jgi:DHA2 family multidrug resistance protein-like MFS transporter
MSQDLTESATEAPTAGRREWLGLAVLALPTLLVSIDVFVMLLALPSISEALHASSTEQLWIMDAYGFMLSGFMVTMGTLGDRIGRRKLLLIGGAAFGTISVIAAYSSGPLQLIVARGALGIAGATLAPSTLALISNMFRNAAQRGVAIGIWFACFMGGAVLGPVVGGAMLAHFWWGSVLLLGVPAMVLLLILGPILVPEYRNPGAGRLDPISVGLSLTAILPIVYGLKEVAHRGVAAGPVLATVLGIGVGLVFLARQRRLEHPLVDVRLFRNRSFSTALGTMFGCTLLAGAMMLFITEYLQLVKGLSPLRAAFWMLPAVAATSITFLGSPHLAKRVRPAYLIAGGLVLSAVGLLIVVSARPESSPWVIVAGWAVMNIGAGPTVTLGTNMVLGAVPPERAGSAAALNETAGEFGFALGIAALGSIGTAVYRSHLPESAPPAARETLAGAVSSAARLPSQAGATLLEQARVAYTAGLQTAGLLAAVVLAGLAALVIGVLRRDRPPAPPSDAPAPDHTEYVGASD